ncbi:MAG: HAMP domain-containing histidine kinase [Actinomycetota bacterium]|nr:HAMP domain-containing histidine kinase [Actinomycetota bacterium]
MNELDGRRGRIVIEESPEILVLLDQDGHVLACSRRARVEGVEEGAQLPAQLATLIPTEVAYELDGRRERLLYFGGPGTVAAYEELRAGFTAAVSHELRTPLARLLALLEAAELPGAELAPLVEQARSEVAYAKELIDEVLFLSELETGREVVALGRTPALPVLREVAERLRARAERAGVRVEVTGDATIEVPLRQRMLRVVAENLSENAIRYAGEGTTFRLALRREGEVISLVAADDGAGVADADLPRLFERFYRGDRARASRGTGLGLAIVKHVVLAAGGQVEAKGGRGRGLTVRCTFPPS